MSPIFLKDYTWNQTDRIMIINVCIPGISIHNSDLSITDKYIKISCGNYIWELFLADEIDFDESKAKIGDGMAVVRLTKKQIGLWDSIDHSPSGDRLIELRQSEMAKMSERLRQRQEKHLNSRQQLQCQARQQYQKIVEEEKNRLFEQIERDKKETLNGCASNFEPLLETNHVATPIRAPQSIRVQFTTRN